MVNVEDDARTPSSATPEVLALLGATLHTDAKGSRCTIPPFREVFPPRSETQKTLTTGWACGRGMKTIDRPDKNKSSQSEAWH